MSADGAVCLSSLLWCGTGCTVYSEVFPCQGQVIKLRSLGHGPYLSLGPGDVNTWALLSSLLHNAAHEKKEYRVLALPTWQGEASHV